MASKPIQYTFFFSLFLAVIIIMLLVLKPFLSSLVLALSFAIVLSPLYERMVRAFKGRRTIAALVVVATVIIVVLIPLFLIGQLLFNEAK
jgi:predicted PurR-regulated permease PerM